MKSLWFILLLPLIPFADIYAQDEQVEITEKKEAPAFKLFRANEDYSYLKDKENSPYETDFFDAIKCIPLNKTKSVNLLFGGEIRPRLEHFSNRKWNNEDQTFYSQRLSLHTKWNLTKYVTVFGEFYHGLVSLKEGEFAQSDLLNVHQGFVDFHLPFQSKTRLDVRFGRQELALGTARLVGLRNGPNIRRSFDMGRVLLKQEKIKMELFYGTEVIPKFGVFDNDFAFFDPNANNSKLWGAYTQFQLKKDPSKTEVYYLGFHSKFSFYNDTTGNDLRHTFGLRRFGYLNKTWLYNTELMIQSGRTANKTALAWALEIDWKYVLNKFKMKPTFGVKANIISGDQTYGDDKLGTFNPMFANPAFFSLAGTIAPVNLIEFHPSFSIKPNKKTTIYLEWALFNRYSTQDGVYAPPRFLSQEGHTSKARFIGNQLGLKAQYEATRHLSIDLDLSYFIAGKFLKETGKALNIFHVAPTISYKF